MFVKKVIIFFLILNLGCVKKSDYLERHFKQLQELSTPTQLAEFRKLPLDSAVINSSRFDAIFVDAAARILKDSVERSALNSYFESYNIKLLGRQDKWTIIAAFHKYLNKENYDIQDLWQEMCELSNHEYEKQYPNSKN